MTDLFTKSATCECEPGDPRNNLGLVEGHTAVWICTHVECFEKRFNTKWVLKE